MDPSGEPSLGIAKLTSEEQDESNGDGDGDDDVIRVETHLTVRAMRLADGTMPAWSWLDGLSPWDRGRVAAAMTVLNSSLSSGRPTDDRLLQLQSRCGLAALVVDEDAPHPSLVALCKLIGDDLWVATGLSLRCADLTPVAIDSADRVAAEWMSIGGADE
jgi:hypothetical protein